MTPNAKPIGWVILDPKGVPLVETVRFRRGLDPDALRFGAWDMFCEDYADIAAFDNCNTTDAIVRKAKRLGYRAVRVYVEGGDA